MKTHAQGHGTTPLTTRDAPVKLFKDTLAKAIVADWDGLAPPEGAQAVFRKLPSGPDKRLVMLGEGTHFVLLEKNRVQLFHEVQLFLDGARLTN